LLKSLLILAHIHLAALTPMPVLDHCNVSWNEVAGADGYKVYFSTVKGGAGTLQAVVNTNAWSCSPRSLTNHTVYYVTATAFASGIGESPRSNEFAFCFVNHGARKC